MLFLNCERTYGLTEVPASIYDRKPDARCFDTIHNILRCLSPAQSLLKGRNAPIWRQREPTHMRLPGTDGLNNFQPYRVHRKTLNPVFNETFNFKVSTLQYFSVWFSTATASFFFKNMKFEQNYYSTKAHRNSNKVLKISTIRPSVLRILGVKSVSKIWYPVHLKRPGILFSYENPSPLSCKIRAFRAP